MSFYIDDRGDVKAGNVILTILVSIGAIIGIIVLLCTVLPPYSIWQAEMAGKAELAQADQNRQIQIAQSKAKAEAAKYEADAEIARAEGVAKANKIIGDSLKGNEDYLRYLYINGLVENKDQKELVYIPTEAGLPILEAGRFNKK